MEAFIGEIRAFPFTYTPSGWLECDGREVRIEHYMALHAVIGDLYGTAAHGAFRLPDLRGRAVLGSDRNMAPYPLDRKLGRSTVTLTPAQMPPHKHALQTQLATTRDTTPSSTALMSFPRYTRNGTTYNIPTHSKNAKSVDAELAIAAIGIKGGSEPHSNLSPFSIVRFCINHDGEFPAG